MMKRFIRLFFLAAVAVSACGVVHAADNGICKPLCDSDKRECRSQAANMSDDEAPPLLAMADKNPNARVSRGLADKPTEAQTKQAYESRRVKMQRTCDTQYLRCVQGCAKEEAAAARPAQ